MCLIHTHHADTKLSDAWIGDFYSHNSDGIGVMYSEPDAQGVDQLVVKKYLPKDEADAIKFYHDTIKGRECVVHWRMATHGDIDLHNCHPYEITPLDSAEPLWMMHNGVLSYGNYGDKSKSDTWHYINDVLKPFLDPKQGGNPALAFTFAFKELVGEAIGSGNRFVLMDRTGQVSIVNQHTGVNWNFMWMSNTYAWSAPSGLSTKRPGGLPRDMSNDWKDEPDDWVHQYRTARNYRGAAWDDFDSALPTYPTKGGTYLPPTKVGATKGNGTVVTGTNFAGGKKNKKRKSKNALVPAGVAAPTPIGARPSDEYLDQVDEVFDLLFDEGFNKAYSNLTYQNFTQFVNKNSMDTLVTYTCKLIDGELQKVTADGTREEAEALYIDTIKHPPKMNFEKPAKVNVGSGDSYPVTELEHQELQDELDAAFEDEVINATLPRQLVSESTSRFAEAAARELDQVRAN